MDHGSNPTTVVSLESSVVKTPVSKLEPNTKKENYTRVVSGSNRETVVVETVAVGAEHGDNCDVRYAIGDAGYSSVYQ